jgi:sugar phosphate isomerase/epimerase
VFDGGETGSVEEIDSAGQLIGWWDERFAASMGQIELAIETHDALSKPDALQRFLDRIPTGRILWDTHHTWKEGGEAPAQTWERLRGRTNHLHVKDSRSSGASYAYVPPGRGEYPFGELQQCLAADQFTGTISLEWERYWFPDLPPIAEALDGFNQVFGFLAADTAPNSAMGSLT